MLKHNNKLISKFLGTILKGNDINNIDPKSLFSTFKKPNNENWETYDFKFMTELVDMLKELNTRDLHSLIKRSEPYNQYDYPVYTDKELVKSFNEKIDEANKNIIPAKDKTLLNIMKKNANIITPGFTGSPFDTPLSTINMLNVRRLTGSNMKPNFLFFQWMSSSYMLMVELNILNKAKIYLDNQYSLNPVILSPEFEESYRC